MQVDIITFLLVEGLLVLGVVIWRLMRKIESQESVIVEQQQFIETVATAINYSNETIKQLDNRGAFESDDEIGVFFQNIKMIQEELNNFTTKRPYGG